MRDVWLPDEGGAYIVSCRTYASSYRTVNGEKVALKDLYAPAFEDIIQSFDILAEACRPCGAEAEATGTAPAEEMPLAATAKEKGAPPASGMQLPDHGDGAHLRLVLAARRGVRRLRPVGMHRRSPGGSHPITLTALVTNRADGGSGYSTPVRVVVTDPAGEADWTGAVYLQNRWPRRTQRTARGGAIPPRAISSCRRAMWDPTAASKCGSNGWRRSRFTWR